MATLRPLESITLAVVAILAPAAAGAQAAVTVADVVVAEPGGNGSNIVTFTLRLADTTRTLFLQVSTAIPTGVPAATPAPSGAGCGGTTDYLPLTAVGVTLSNTARQATVTVPICGDAFDETDERFLLRIAQANGQAIDDNEAVATITDDDPTPSLRINDVQLTEPASGGTAIATFNVSLSAASGQPVSFNWETAAEQAGLPATGGSCGGAGSDFTSVPATARTIAAGSPSTSVTVTVCGDGVHEGNEQLRLRLSGAANATMADDAGVLTIIDREPPPSIAIEPTVNFGTSNPPSPIMGVATFVITLNGPPTERPVTIDYATVNGTAIGATGCLDVNFGGVVRKGGDYITKSATNLALAGQSTRLGVSYCKLRNVSGKTFTLQLSNVRNAAPASLSRTVTLP